MSARARRIVQNVVREPLVHFLVAGFVLFIVGDIYRRDHDLYRIVVTPDRVAQLSESYRQQYGQNPSPAVREALVVADIDNEVLFREGLALKLDQGDEIVRRRIIQKMQFLSDNMSVPAEPGEAQIAAYYRKHPERYARGPTASFTHVFFSSDSGGSQAAFDRASRALPGLGARLRAPEAGDLFPDLFDFAQIGPDQVKRLFGDTGFSKAVFAAPVAQWTGPFQSGYGWHLLKVTARAPLTALPLDQVRERVRTDLLDEQQRDANTAAARTRRMRFTVVRDDMR